MILNRVKLEHIVTFTKYIASVVPLTLPPKTLIKIWSQWKMFFAIDLSMFKVNALEIDY